MPGEEAWLTLLRSNGEEKHQHPHPLTISLTFDDGSSDQYALRSILIEHSMRATFYISSGAVGMPGYMSWDQLAELAADGNEIGGHTVDHLKLTTLSASEATRQIADDRQALMRHGLTVTNFAYPYGDHNPAVEAIVQASGYSSARRAWGLSPIDKTRPKCHRWYPDVAETNPAGQPLRDPGDRPERAQYRRRAREPRHARREERWWLGDPPLPPRGLQLRRGQRLFRKARGPQAIPRMARAQSGPRHARAHRP